jgi:PhnB protein
MTTHLNPYLGFRDTARSAMEFYQSVFGGELTMSTFGEGGMSDDPAEKDKVMHSQLASGIGLLMASDAPAQMDLPSSSPHSLSVSGEDETELRGYWDKLVEGGTVALPLEKAPWGDTFGMCVDRFGVNWMVNIVGTGNAG